MAEEYQREEAADRVLTIEERVRMIPILHQKGYTCAQTVLCVYADLLGMDERDLFRISEGFGGGMGGMMLTCGAVTSMAMAASPEKQLRRSGELQYKGIQHPPGEKAGHTVSGEKRFGDLPGAERGWIPGRFCGTAPAVSRDAIRIMGRELFGLES